MLKIKNTIVLLIFAFVLCATNNVSAQDSCRFAAYKFLPVAVSAIIPAYPAQAVVAKAEGNALVDIKIDTSGKVIEATFVSGHELLKKPVLDAALKWKFDETNEDVGIRGVRLTFIFYLNDDNYEEQNKDEIRYKYHLKIYRPYVSGDCFNNCGNDKEK